MTFAIKVLGTISVAIMVAAAFFVAAALLFSVVKKLFKD